MARILIVDDDAALRLSLAETIGDLGHETVLAAGGAEAFAAMQRHRADAVLLDLRMPGQDGLAVLARLRTERPGLPIAILTAVPDAANTIEAMRLGAVDHVGKPVGRADVAALVERLLAAGLTRPTAGAEPRQAAAEVLIGRSPAMRDVQKRIGMLADNDASVLITGETGTGKEVVARAIHRHGRRGSRPFVPVNCAAIPAALLESELFGHARGAFTGAVADRTGAFRDAQGGTLFLDEIGDMPLDMQAKLLRVLQERVVTPVGGRPVAVDVRIVSATHRALADAVASGAFRADLFYRLSVVPLVLPPLRERLSDIVELAEAFLPAGRSLSAEAASCLLAHGWPGNVRELQNAIRRAAALTTGAVIRPTDLVFLRDGVRVAAPSTGVDWTGLTLDEGVERLERAMIEQALARSAGNRTEAARALGIHRQLLHAKLTRYGLVSGQATGVVRKDYEER